MLLKRITILIIFACFFITSCDDENKTSLGSFDLAIENVKLFDGENIFENVSLFIKDDKIDRIIINNESMYEASSVISGAGKTIAPGLIDAHVHLENEEDLSIAAESGVLTLLDLGIFDTVKAGELRQSGEENSSYAYYYSAGILVSCQGGIWSGKLNSIGIDPLSDGSDVPSYIQDRVNEGSDFIKLMLDPGKNNNFTVVSDEMIQSCINEAHGQGLNCYVHAVRVEDALRSLRARHPPDGRRSAPSPVRCPPATATRAHPGPCP